MDFILQKLLSIFFCFLILVNARICRYFFGSYLHPSSLFSLAWFFFTFIPIVFVYEVPLNPFAIFYIFSITLMFSLGAIPFPWKLLKLNEENFNKKIDYLNSSFLRFSLVFSIIFSIIFSSMVIIENGFNFNQFLIDFVSTSAAFAKQRGTENINYGIYGVLSVFFTYFSALIGGVISFFKLSNLNKFKIYIISILPSVFVMVTQSSKIIFLISTIFFISSIFLLMVYKRKDLKITIKETAKIGLFFLSLFPLIILTFILREGYNNFFNLNDALQTLKPPINSYFFGSVYAFADFFSYYTNSTSFSNYEIEYFQMGYYSFKPIFELFGGTKTFPVGYYPDYFSYNNIIATNIFTAFRGFIQDFGLIGTLLFFFIFSFLINLCYFKILNGKQEWFCSAIYIMFIAYLGLSFLLNIFTARYVFLIVLAFYLIMKINYSIIKSKR